MIRINLLSRERARSRGRKAPTEAGHKITVASTLILVGAGLVIGWWYWSLDKDAARVADELASAEQETARLRTIIVQVQQFDQRKAQLQERVTLIEQLRKGQSGPVHMLDEISRALPDMLWLTALVQNGGDLSIEGRCIAYTSLSDFVANLQRSGWFKRPVEIFDSQVERPAGVDIDLIRFTVKARFAPPGG
jgi:type IV pilus assembly protein PilN